jgi:hypothetical protein
VGLKERILAAGFTYPANWNEMGSSEKDLWEDNTIAYLDRRGEAGS